jgi:HAD superfamily hydrolase (TIGR01509 family)
MQAIKLVLFDLDGVLIDAKEIHFQALNLALGSDNAISREDHINTYDGLPTLEKLKLKGIDSSLVDEISAKKQEFTLGMISQLKPIPEIVNLFKMLVERGYKIGVCTNSIRKTVLTALSTTGLMKYVDIVLSNEDVKNAKPHPEMYWKAMSMMSVLPENTLIVEDSPKGLLSAIRSNAKYVRVRSPFDVTWENISPHLEGKRMQKKWVSNDLNVIIPMAGAGSRFADAGYTFPKPLIDVNNKPMIHHVVDNIGIEANYIFVVQKEHREKYNLDTLLNLITPNCTIVEVDGLTEGSACTTLLAKEHIDNDKPLFFANSDQHVVWDPMDFMYEMQESKVDGGIVTFKATHPKWSFAKSDKNGFVTEVAEKNPISDNATVGFYYWKKGSDYVKYAEQMIEKNIRTNNEFYICPVFNEAIGDSKKVKMYECEEMWGLGTPEDLQNYLNNYKR